MNQLLRLIEPLESRIAPAIVIANPIFDIKAGTGQTGTVIDLGKLVDASKSYRTVVEFVTNFTLPGESSPGVIRIELFDDKAPLTVANFLHYLNNQNKSADYDGTFFHRLASGFVLQGGGYNTTDPNNHIATFPEVHNEANPSDPELSNLIQTISMAKVEAGQGGGANSASSEFFINLKDNSSNLDARNGGFTVFGRVTDSSMAVINAIASLQTAGSEGPPLQNYSGGNPTSAQFVTITDARVVPPPVGDNHGLQFEVEVVDATTDLPSKVVTAKLNPATNQLELKYSSTLSGEAKVRVKISGEGETTVVDEFTVTVKPDLIADISDDGLRSTFVPGDKGTAKVVVSNAGGGIAKGQVNIKLYLSKTNPGTVDGAFSDLDGFTVDPDPSTGDRLLAQLNNVNVNIKAGGSVTIPIKYTVAVEAAGGGAALADGTGYRLLAVVETAEGSTIQEIFPSDSNVGTFTKQTESLTSPNVLRTFDLAFGTVGGRAGVPLTVPDVDGDNLTFLLKGPGRGDVVQNEDGTISVSVSGTTASSSLKITTAKGVVADLQELEFDNAVGTVSLANVHLHGNFRASEGLKSLTLGDLGASAGSLEEVTEHTISIGAFTSATQKLSLNFGQVRDYSFSSEMTIGTLAAKGWLDDELNTPKSRIVAPAIGSLKITGDLEADVLLQGTSKLDLFSVTGAVKEVSVRTFGDVTKVQVGSLKDSEFLVGVVEKPDSVGDFVSGRTIGTFTVNGVLSNSTVAAAKFTSVSVGEVQDGGSSAGFYADAIKTYLRKAPLPAVKLTNLDAPNTDVDGTVNNYEVVIF